jgi:cytidine deaminase
MDKKIFDKMYKICSKIALNSRDLHKKTERSQVGCCIVAESGKMYTGLNVGWWHSSCAEVSALANAWQAGERELKYVMSVKFNFRTQQLECVTPCGICREMFHHLQPEIDVVYVENGEYIVKTLEEMLPDIDDISHELQHKHK